MMVLVALLIGIAVGIMAAIIFFCQKEVGTLRLNNSDPDSGPYLFMEIARGKTEVIAKSKAIVLRVDLSDYLPRE